MLETLSALFAAHVLADYVFQNDHMVETKDQSETLFLHGLIVLATAMLTTGQVAATPIYALAAAHVAIDIVKSRVFSDSLAPHLGDQAAHLITLGIVASCAPDLWATGLWGDAPAWVIHALLSLAGLIYATRAGGFAIAKLMAPYADALPKPAPLYDFEDSAAASLAHGGQTIGLLERGLIFALMLGNLAAGIGFLIAAKSVLRFDAKSDNRKAEYVIIGTLASFGWAIAVALVINALRAHLPALGN